MNRSIKTIQGTTGRETISQTWERAARVVPAASKDRDKVIPQPTKTERTRTINVPVMPRTGIIFPGIFF